MASTIAIMSSWAAFCFLLARIVGHFASQKSNTPFIADFLTSTTTFMILFLVYPLYAGVVI